MNEHLEALFSFRKNAPDSVIDLEKKHIKREIFRAALKYLLEFKSNYLYF